MHQKTMFGAVGGRAVYVQPDPPSNGTATSNAAAESIKPHVNHLQQTVLDALRRCPGGTTAQALEDLTGLEGNCVRPRLIELRRKGLVRDSGTTRPTASGRQAVVWVAVSGGTS